MEKIDATAEEEGTEMDEMGKKSRLFAKKKILYNK
jgi:hypothetical protein